MGEITYVEACMVRKPYHSHSTESVQICREKIGADAHASEDVLWVYMFFWKFQGNYFLSTNASWLLFICKYIDAHSNFLFFYIWRRLQW
ncbi:MAG: hypothetical protein ACD_71C00116G0004, partial [uncultured bacterium (gcode 4)]